MTVVAGLVLGATVPAGAAGGRSKPSRTAPAVVIASPTAGAALNGTVTVTGSASSSVSVTSVAVAVDAGAYQSAGGTTSWTFSLPTTAYAAGPHTISARMTDSSGASATTSVSVSFSNATPPAVVVAAPSSGAVVGGTATVYGGASSPIGVASVDVSVDGRAFQPAQGTTRWTYALDTTTFANGSHTVVARATDTSGNSSTATTSLTFQNSTTPVSAPAMAGGTIGGYVFQDPNRDRQFETGEGTFANLHLYLYDGSGAYLGNTYTNASGWYVFTGLGDGPYTVRVAGDAWVSIRDAWVSSSAPTAPPAAAAQLAGTARADIAVRPIVRSTVASVPISSTTLAIGVTVQSYDDVVAATTVADALMAGSLVGPEARYVTVRFDFPGTTGVTSTSAMKDTSGTYVSYVAVSYIDWDSWLDAGDRQLFHEYGHAWSLYYAYIVQQDPTFTAYLKARGLYCDARVGTSYAWDPKEMIAEDYRELFGTANAQSGGQINTAIPMAKDVPGLQTFLASTYTQPGA